MASSIMTRLDHVLQYVEREILPGVGGDQRSELRAALKVLGALRLEIDLLPSLLESEIRESLELVKLAVAVLGSDPKDALTSRFKDLRRAALENPASLSRLEQLREDAVRLLSDITIVLGDGLPGEGDLAMQKSQAVESIYRHLTKSAAARLRFQSVFPAELYASSSRLQGANT